MITIILCLITTSISLGSLGPLVLWSRISNIGDGLAHTIVFSLVLNYFLGISITLSALIVSIFFVLILEFTSRDKKVDSSSKIVILSCLSISMTLLISDISGGSIKLQELLVGDAFAITGTDLLISVFLMVLIIIFIWYNYNNIIIATISSSIAEVKGINIKVLSLSIKLIVAITVSLSIGIVGVLLMSSLLIIPASIARLISRSPSQMIFMSSAVASISGIFSTWISLTYDLAYGPTLACLLSLSYLITSLLCSKS